MEAIEMQRIKFNKTLLKPSDSRNEILSQSMSGDILIDDATTSMHKRGVYHQKSMH